MYALQFFKKMYILHTDYHIKGYRNFSMMNEHCKCNQLSKNPHSLHLPVFVWTDLFSRITLGFTSAFSRLCWLILKVF